jgi:hypothetical protein
MIFTTLLLFANPIAALSYKNTPRYPLAHTIEMDRVVSPDSYEAASKKGNTVFTVQITPKAAQNKTIVKKTQVVLRVFVVVISVFAIICLYRYVAKQKDLDEAQVPTFKLQEKKGTILLTFSHKIAEDLSLLNKLRDDLKVVFLYYIGSVHTELTYLFTSQVLLIKKLEECSLEWLQGKERYMAQNLQVQSLSSFTRKEKWVREAITVNDKQLEACADQNIEIIVQAAKAYNKTPLEVSKALQEVQVVAEARINWNTGDEVVAKARSLIAKQVKELNTAVLTQGDEAYRKISLIYKSHGKAQRQVSRLLSFPKCREWEDIPLPTKSFTEYIRAECEVFKLKGKIMLAQSDEELVDLEKQKHPSSVVFAEATSEVKRVRYLLAIREQALVSFSEAHEKLFMTLNEFRDASLEIYMQKLEESAKTYQNLTQNYIEAYQLKP